MSKLREALKAYKKAILESLLMSIFIALSFAFIFTNAKLKSLKLGTHPDMPKHEIDQLYEAAYPTVIVEGIIIYFAIFVPFIIIHLLIRFKYYYDINLFKVLADLIRKRK